MVIIIITPTIITIIITKVMNKLNLMKKMKNNKMLKDMILKKIQNKKDPIEFGINYNLYFSCY